MKTHKLHLLSEFAAVEIEDYDELDDAPTSADEVLRLLFSDVPGEVPNIIAERIADRLSIRTDAMIGVLNELMREADERLEGSEFWEDEEWAEANRGGRE